jgi:hypothetical protein
MWFQRAPLRMTSSGQTQYQYKVAPYPFLLSHPNYLPTNKSLTRRYASVTFSFSVHLKNSAKESSDIVLRTEADAISAVITQPHYTSTRILYNNLQHVWL